MEVVGSTDKFDELKCEWDKLAALSDSTIFQTYIWNRTWWRHFGGENRLHLVLFRDGRRLVGIAPLFRDRVATGGKTLYSSLRWIGSNVSRPGGKEVLGTISYTDYLDLLIRPGYEMAVGVQFAKHIEKIMLHTDEIILDAVPERSLLFQSVVPFLQKKSISVDVEKSSDHQIIAFTGCWEEYLMSLSKNRRSHARRAVKKVLQGDQKLFDIQDIRTEKELEVSYEELVRLHQKKWNRAGSLGSFAEERNYLFHKEVTAQFFRKGWVQFRRLIPSVERGQTVALELNYRYKRRLYGIHCAVDIHSPYYKSGPGSVLIYMTLKEAIEQKMEQFDFLRGMEPYKRVMANLTPATGKIQIRSGKTGGLIRIQLINKALRLKKDLSRERMLLQIYCSDRTFLGGTLEYLTLLKSRIPNRIRSQAS